MSFKQQNNQGILEDAAGNRLHCQKTVKAPTGDGDCAELPFPYKKEKWRRRSSEEEKRQRRSSEEEKRQRRSSEGEAVWR